jgi:hypothetical protein
MRRGRVWPAGAGGAGSAWGAGGVWGGGGIFNKINGIDKYRHTGVLPVHPPT